MMESHTHVTMENIPAIFPKISGGWGYVQFMRERAWTTRPGRG